MAGPSNYDLLISKLDAFIRKYYLNQLVKGTLLTVGLVGVVFLLISLGENYFYFSKTARKLLFFSFLGLSAFTLIRWVLIPMLHYFQLGKLISHEQAASIIGQHFGHVEDKLLNILQLKQQLDKQPEASLLLAGIEQKTETLRPVSFPAAIDLSNNRRYLKYALPPLALLFILLWAAPSMIKDPARRLIDNNKDFAPPAPFTFVLGDAPLKVVQYGDFELEVTTEGSAIPNEVFIEIGEYQYRLKPIDRNLFSYTFSNVNKDTEFRLFSGRVTSESKLLDVLLKPSISSFSVSVDYPQYVGRPDEILSNIGDLVVPQGTRLSWSFETAHTDSISMRFGEGSDPEAIKRQGEHIFVYSKRATRDERYTVLVSNQELPKADSIRYVLSVIPDLHPSIQANSFTDSLDNAYVFFAGEAADDYGLSQLSFTYQIKHQNGDEEKAVIRPVPLQKGKEARFDYTLDIQALKLAPGDEVTYWFEVWDNDAINGRKSSRTNLMRYTKPTAEEFDDQEEKNNDEIRDHLKKAMDESKKIQKDIKKLSEKLLQEKDLDWQSRKELEKLLNRRKELMQDIQQAKDLFDQNLKNQEEFSEPSPELKEKQEKVQQMFEELVSPEMKELMKKIEEMLQELQKDESLKQLEEMKMDEEQLDKELDRMMEMYKQLEVEKDLQDQIEKLKELAKEQENLAEKTENETETPESLEKKQEELNEKFDDLQEKMKEIEKKNEELENPKELGDPEEKMEDIDQDMEDSKDQLEKKQNSKASKSQKGAAQKMKDMAQAMEMNMQQGEEEQLEEDMKALRQLLENLVTLSFDQEGLISSVNQTAETAPRYVKLVQEQKKIQDDFRLVEDSLQALSKRVIQIETYVTEKVTEIKGHMNKTLKQLEERQKPQAAAEQQFAMKNLNDLALMLSEVLNQMQQQASNQMAGNQNCQNPGGSNPKPGGTPKDKMGGGQKSLNEMMKDLQGRMKNGEGGSSKEFAKMAAKQAAMRKALEDMNKEKRQSGKPDPLLQDIIDQMDKTEIDLVNKRLSAETMKRQEDILSKLLDHERAEREREYDNKRKSETASQYDRKRPPSLEEYLKKREAETELYRTVSPALKPYYKNLVEEYQRNLKITR